MIRVLLVDDHRPLRAGTRALLAEAPDITIVAETGSGTEALELTAQLQPDLVLLDLKLPDISGVAVARTLRQDWPAVRVLVLSAYDYEQYVRALFAIGVDGYLLKSDSGLELIGAVRSVMQGQQAISAEVMAQLRASPRHSGIVAGGTLSPREREVLTLVGQGARNKEIAQQLQIKVTTVETYLTNIMAKLTVQSRAEAVRVALQRGIIVPDG